MSTAKPKSQTKQAPAAATAGATTPAQTGNHKKPAAVASSKVTTASSALAQDFTLRDAEQTGMQSRWDEEQDALRRLHVAERHYIEATARRRANIDNILIDRKRRLPDGYSYEWSPTLPTRLVAVHSDQRAALMGSAGMAFAMAAAAK